MSSGDAECAGRQGAPRAAAALCGLYHEAGQRLRRLQDQLAARDALIARLRARLAALEGDTAPSLVDALLEQVARFREQLRQRDGGAAEAALRQEIERLSEQLEEKEREAQQLLSQPGLEREKEVALLRRSVAEKERARAASHVLCRSLADETHQLRRTLAATAHMCQHLAKCLDERQGAPGAAGEQSPEPECADGDASVHAVVEKLREENRVLRQKVTHVEDLNARWQRYDASRDEYVRGLHAQLKGLQATPEPELMRKEVSRLNAQLEEKMDDCAEARRELAAAKSARDAALERVQMLEQQILAYKDDFTSERADRERAQSRIHELEEQVALLQRQASWRQVQPGSPRARGGGRLRFSFTHFEPSCGCQDVGSPAPANLRVARVRAWRVASAGLSWSHGPSVLRVAPTWASSLVGTGRSSDPSVVLGTSSFRPRHQSEGVGPTKRRTGLQTLEPRPASGADSCLFLGFARASLLPDSHGEQISQILRDRRFGACGGRWPEAWDGIPVAGPPRRGRVLGSDPGRPGGPAVPPLPAVLQRRAGRGALQARGRVLPVSPGARGGRAPHPDRGPQHRLGVLLSLLLGCSWVSGSF